MFRFPFKFLGYVALFSVIAGAVALERLMRYQPWRKSVEPPLAALVLAVLAYHCSLSTSAFGKYSFTPFPAPNPVLKSLLAPQNSRDYPRILPIFVGESGNLEVFGYGGFRSRDASFIESYANEWPTIQGAFSVDGYDPLVSRSALMERVLGRFSANTDRALFEYGVRYVLQYNSEESQKNGRPPRQEWVNGRLAYQSASVDLTELWAARPMCFPVGAPWVALPVQFDGGGAIVETELIRDGGLITLNMLWRKEIRAEAKGSQLETRADDWDRIMVGSSTWS